MKQTTLAIVFAGLLTVALPGCSEESDPLAVAASPPGRPPAPEGMVYSAWLPQGCTIVVEDRSMVADADEPIHIACDRNDWAPDDPDWRMTHEGDGVWSLDVDPPGSDVEDQALRFKFTRGSWESIECHTDGADVRNRLLPLILRMRVEQGERPRLDHVVVGWADQFDERAGGPSRPAIRE
ncbi:MAG: hypothetical protein RIB58_04900 [Phycisphaerales bacterium]